jgi:outer membrane protein assembly factor BamB
MYAFSIEEKKLGWYFHAGDRIDVPAVPAMGRVAFASRNSRMYVTPSDQRRTLFEFITDEPVSTALSRSGPWLFLPSQDHNVYAVNIQNGQMRWRKPFGYPFNEAPTPAGEKLYVTLLRGGMYQVDIESGDDDWFNRTASNFLSASRERLYTTDKGGQLLILDRATGSTLGSFDVTDFRHRLKNERTDRIYLATDAGLVVCLRQRDLAYPLFLQPEDNELIMPEFSTDLRDPLLDVPTPPSNTRPGGTDRGRTRAR